MAVDGGAAAPPVTIATDLRAATGDASGVSLGAPPESTTAGAATDATTGPRLPAVRIDAQGRRRVDLRAVAALALPLMANSTLQLVLNLTDTWFIGHLSTDALAAMGAVHFFALVFLIALGGVGFVVQTLVAQAWGAGRPDLAARSTWQGLWAALATGPLFVLLALHGDWLLAWFSLPPAVAALGVDWWWPRMLGGPLSVALWAVTGFFNGIGRTRITLFVSIGVAIGNALLDWWFIFGLDGGITGAAWATTASVALGYALLLAVFLSPRWQAACRTRSAWRPDLALLRQVFALGVPSGLFPAIDVVGVSLFQLMQVSLGAVPGGATQIVMMLTAMAYLPCIGIAMAGTTLVGQSIGAGDPKWAMRLGNVTVIAAVAWMALLGAVIALAGPWLIPRFVDASLPEGPAVIALAITLVWIAGGYQVFDALNLASAFCLRGAGDVRVPMLLLIVLAWGGYVPLARMLSFAPGEGWVHGLPQFGWGATGGWIASLVYIVTLGVVLWLRWRSGRWQRMGSLAASNPSPDTPSTPAS